MGSQRGELGILLVDDREIAALNERFLGRKGSTDVISFPMGKGIEGVPVLLGDVVISVEMAKRVAEERGLSLYEEVARLLVHGILHIFGYDHEGDEEASVMEGMEKRMMEDLKGKGLI